MSTAASSTKPADKTAEKNGKVKPQPSPAELRAALGLPESATDTEVRSAQKIKRFKDVAAKRTNRALEAMANLTRCANRANYTYTDEQVDTIIVALEDEVEKIKAAFTAQPGVEKPTVTL
jgi:hypothetical protein